MKAKWIFLIALVLSASCAVQRPLKPEAKRPLPYLAGVIAPQVISTSKQIVFEYQWAQGDQEQKEFYFFAPPERELSIEVMNCRLQKISGQEGPAELNWEILKNNKPQLENLQKGIQIEEVGYVRFNRIVRVKVTTVLYNLISEANYCLNYVQVALNFDRPYEVRKDFEDTALQDLGKGFGRILSGFIANYAAYKQYANAAPPANVSTPRDDWPPEEYKENNVSLFKLGIKDVGLYKIDANYLRQAGLKPAEINPRYLHLYCQGQEVPLMIIGGLARYFTPADYIVFYSQPADSEYTDTNIYWLVYDETKESLRIPSIKLEATEGQALKPLAYYYAEKSIDEDKELKIHSGHFLSIRGMRWVGENLPVGETIVKEFDLPFLVALRGKGKGTLRLYWQPEGFNPKAVVTCNINDHQLPKIRFKNTDDDEKSFSLPYSVLKARGNKLEMTLQEVIEGDKKEAVPSALYLDYLRFLYPRQFVAVDGELLFSSDNPSTPIMNYYQIKGIKKMAVLMDLSEPQARKCSLLIPQRGEPLNFKIEESGKSSFVLKEVDAIDCPPEAHLVKLANLRSPEKGGDYLIISHQKFLPVLDPLIELKKQDGFSPRVVEVEDIYNEFNDGLEGPEAIKLFLDYALRHWSPRPEYVLLVGDCTSDYKRFTRNEIINYVPTFTFYSKDSFQDRWASDHWYTTLCGKDLFQDLIIGRISFDNLEDARTVIGKVINYSRNPELGLWRQTLVYVADNGNFDEQCEELRLEYTAAQFLGKTIYLDDLPWEDNYYLPEELVEEEKAKVSTEATTRIMKTIDKGCSYITFYGHGSPNIWSDERMWFGGGSENSDNLNLRNYEKLPFIVNMTCNSGAIDYPVAKWNICISEDFMRVKKGGAIGLFVPSGPGYTSNHIKLSIELRNAIWGSGLHRLGDITTAAGFHYLLKGYLSEIPQMFVLLGEPSLKLQIPEQLFSLSIEPTVVKPAKVGQFNIRGKIASLEQGKVIFTVIDPDNQVYEQSSPLNFKGGGLKYTFKLNEPVKRGEWIVTAYCWDEAAGTDAVGAGSLWVDEPFLKIESLEQQGNEGVKPDESTKLVGRLKNYSQFELADVKLVLSCWRDNKEEELQSRVVSVIGKEEKTIEFTTPAKPGLSVYRLKLENYWESPDPTVEESREKLLAVPVISDEEEIDVALTPLLLEKHLTPRGSQYLLQIESPVFFLSKEAVKGIKVALLDAQGKKWQEQRLILPSSGSIRSTTARLSVNLKELEQREFILSLILPENVNDEGPENNELRFTVSPKGLPDLIIKNVKLVEESPTEGKTVFMDVIVANHGQREAADFFVAAYDKAPEQGGKPLPDFVNGKASQQIKFLRSGGETSVRLRWDPIKNAGLNDIWIKADSNGQLVELDESNNVVKKTIKVRTKAKLRPAGIFMRPQTPEEKEKNIAYLVAVIKNLGETESRNLFVEFFKTKEQTPEEMIDRVFVEEIKPGEIKEVTTRWDISEADRHRLLRPSFRIYLKGSLQRVSSIDFIPE